MISAEETANFELFRDCLSTPLIEKFAAKPPKARQWRKSSYGRKKSQVPTPDVSVENEDSKDAEELSDFINYIALEVFTCLPPELRTLTYTTYTHTPTLQTLYTPPLNPSTTASLLQNLNPSIPDTLTTYALLPPSSPQAPEDLLAPILTSYLTTLTTAPPPPSTTRVLVSGCEICQREHIPLTYHHLIPKMVHEKAAKRGWHTREELNNVAWLCRACHSFVHGFAGHEALARELYTVELLLEREEVRRFAGWVGRVRWKSR